MGTGSSVQTRFHEFWSQIWTTIDRVLSFSLFVVCNSRLQSLFLRMILGFVLECTVCSDVTSDEESRCEG